MTSVDTGRETGIRGRLLFSAPQFIGAALFIVLPFLPWLDTSVITGVPNIL